MPATQDILGIVAPMLRVRPELQDYCRFGGAWQSPHSEEAKGWAVFHIVMQGHCVIERAGQPSIPLDAGDVLLLPHGDAHVVFSGGGRHAQRDAVVTHRDYIRIKQLGDAAVDTELVCGRLHMPAATDNLLIRALPPVVVMRGGGAPGLSHCGALIAMIRDELQADRPGAGPISVDLASALLLKILRQQLADHPPADGLLALLAHRETARAAAAMLADPARPWELDELAAIAAVSRATLVRAFRRISGAAPLGFLAEVRLQLARERIEASPAPLAQIAADAGYQSEASFSRAFLRHFGTRPGAMRSRTREAPEA